MQGTVSRQIPLLVRSFFSSARPTRDAENSDRKLFFSLVEHDMVTGAPVRAANDETSCRMTPR